MVIKVFDNLVDDIIIWLIDTYNYKPNQNNKNLITEWKKLSLAWVVVAMSNSSALKTTSATAKNTKKRPTTFPESISTDSKTTSMNSRYQDKLF